MSEVEPPEDTGFSEHERELLICYTHTTGHDLRQEVGARVYVCVESCCRMKEKVR